MSKLRLIQGGGGNVSSLEARRAGKSDPVERARWAGRYSRMDKLELLEEMVRFQEERSRAGGLSAALVNRGIPLFSALAAAAETSEMRAMAGSYLRHLMREAGLE